MTAPHSLEEVIADRREMASHARRTKSFQIAEVLDEAMDEVEKAAEDYLKFLGETEAVLWSGHSKEWLRSRFPAWERLGHAKLRDHGKKDRMYRRCILPRRADLAAARADAVRTARQESA